VAAAAPRPSLEHVEHVGILLALDDDLRRRALLHAAEAVVDDRVGAGLLDGELDHGRAAGWDVRRLDVRLGIGEGAVSWLLRVGKAPIVLVIFINTFVPYTDRPPFSGW